jgi:exodeoxyribonuclease VII large subunit
MPLLPQRIAIISVNTSKGFSDFINILENNPWGYAFSCILFPAILQGDKAVDSIISQLRRIDRAADYFDVVTIIRGGGGDVGLNCYDNYFLGKEVALCRLPVLTGIGHSTNETVVEMIAGQNKITPTDVAYYIIQHFHNFSARLEENRSKIITLSQELIEGEKRGWRELTRRFKPGLLIREKEIELKNKSEWLAMRVHQLLTHQQVVIDNLGQQVYLLDPQNILRRGYSITYHGGKPLTDSTNINPGEIITTRLYKGEINSEIKSKKE